MNEHFLLFAGGSLLIVAVGIGLHGTAVAVAPSCLHRPRVSPPSSLIASFSCLLTICRFRCRLGLLAGSSSSRELDIVEISQSAWIAGQSKRERNPVILHEVIELDGEDDTDGVMIIGESTSDYKNKQPVGYDKSWQKQVKDPLSANPVIPSANIGSSQSLKGHLIYLDDDEYDYGEVDCDDYDYYYDYGADTSGKDSNLVSAAKFHDIDLPTGVEAPEPWFKKPAAEEPKKNKKIIVEDEIDVNYKSFKQFDTVREHSDHYFSRPELLKTVPTVKKIN
ncbi:uncharacterized protein LOC141816296, partial [Curcuma longa]|uniref:uncharacterized protein LOC141816296 n=1 Tax=Curcuma longa TaxID=136217 RepID=UPI003D9F3322